ncbi:MAG: hypothetical protein JSV58_02820 [Candidatus Bathyarchaeota archaeon]|nr:MAG: hypothetical protein JSV58_02820 [Candidatus Bathyarchaeota archaeon]
MNLKPALNMHLLLFLVLSGALWTSCPLAWSVNEEREVGVKVGDWGLYGNITVTWSSNDPGMEPDESLILSNNTAWFRHDVTVVTGPAVFFRNTTHLKDGTEISNTAWVDIESGTGNGTLMFISAWLNDGVLLYEQTIEPVYINRTLTGTYAGAERLVNHLSLRSSYTVDATEPQNILISLDYYWDQATGILVEREGSFINQTGSYLTSWHKSDMLVETNLWESGGAPPPTINGGSLIPWLLGGAIIVLLGVSIIVYRRRGTEKRAKRRRPTRRR